MKFHIVSSSENIKKIAFLYNMEVEEIKKENRHIRDWVNLIPGTKLKIPVLSEAVLNEINEFEPFIEDYYPKYDLNEKIEEDVYEMNNETIEVNSDEYVSGIESKEIIVNKDEVDDARDNDIECAKNVEKKEENNIINNDIIKQKVLSENVINKYPQYYVIPPYQYMKPVIYPQVIYIVRRSI